MLRIVNARDEYIVILFYCRSYFLVKNTVGVKETVLQRYKTFYSIAGKQTYFFPTDQRVVFYFLMCAD